MDRSPNKSLQKSQSGISRASCTKDLHKSLNLHPYRVSVVQQLYPHDYRLEYSHWFNEQLNNDDLLHLTFFTDEAWFHLSGYVNNQNYRTWDTENPHTFVETDLHPIKVGNLGCNLKTENNRPIFFYETVTAERY